MKRLKNWWQKKKILGAHFEKENRERKLNEEENYGGIEEKRDASTVENCGSFVLAKKLGTLKSKLSYTSKARMIEL